MPDPRIDVEKMIDDLYFLNAAIFGTRKNKEDWVDESIASMIQQLDEVLEEE